MFEWNDYLEVARGLLASSPTLPEATWRTVASRAYYSAFHKCREFLEQQGHEPIRGERVHARVLEGLRQRSDMELTALDLDRMRGKRAHADYNSAREFHRSDAQVIVTLAAEVKQRLVNSP